MKLMKRNLQPVWYALYDTKEPIRDENGYETSEVSITYKDPVKLLCSVSPAKGYAQGAMIGNLESYDKVLITDDMSCPIDENTVLFIDREPTFNADGSPAFDYIVRRVAKSLNNISYAVSKVNVS